MPQPCFSTGLSELDSIIGSGCPGIPRGGLTVIVGETGSGKSSLCRVIASNVATHTMDASAFRVGFADVDGVADPTAYPYNRLSLENLSQLAQVLIRSTFDLVVVDGVEYLATDNYRGGNSPVAERARQIESIFTRVPMPNLALVFTWQVNRASLGLSFNYSIPSALAHRASLILQVENKGQRVRVTKNRFGEPDGVAEFGPRWREILREPPEPEFDRSLIKTRFEREDVI